MIIEISKNETIVACKKISNIKTTEIVLYALII